MRQLERARQFYRLYPIASALRTQLNWSQYKLLIAIDDDYKREYYELESANHGWTGRETERQINSLLYERLLLSNDKESVLAVARKERIPELPADNSNILTSKYQLYLPSEQALLEEIKEVITLAEAETGGDEHGQSDTI
jgi:hypothetical protein